jgi:hypothetical protein
MGRVQTLLSAIAIGILAATPALGAIEQEEFWLQGRQLLAEQVDAIDRLDAALATNNPAQITAAREDVLRNDIRTEFFLRRLGPGSAASCRAGVAGPGLSEQQQRVFCSIANTRQRLMGLLPLLNQRLSLLGLATSPLLPLPDAPNQQRFNLPTATFSLPNTGGQFPAFLPDMVGAPFKPAIADFRPVVLPAFDTAPEVRELLRNARQELVVAAADFPAEIEITVPPSTLERAEQYAILPNEFLRYQEFLQQPDTGIARILPAGVGRRPIDQISNRIQPAQTIPFAPLRSIATSPVVARLTLELDGQGNLQIVQPGLDYGFIWQINDADLRQISGAELVSRLGNRPEFQFMTSYQPPDRLLELQRDRRRFITGKLENFAPANLVSGRVPIALGQTYVIRLIQFQLPDVVVNRRLVARRDRPALNTILQTPSSDLLVAFQPVETGPDGGYTVIWRILQQFRDPQIIDLAEYLELD